jgi:hypothetical protein
MTARPIEHGRNYDVRVSRLSGNKLVALASYFFEDFLESEPLNKKPYYPNTVILESSHLGILVNCPH